MHIKCFHVTKIKEKPCFSHLCCSFNKKWQEIHAVFTWETFFFFFLDVSVQSADNEHNQKEANIKQEKGKYFETILTFSYLLGC